MIRVINIRWATVLIFTLGCQKADNHDISLPQLPPGSDVVALGMSYWGPSDKPIFPRILSSRRLTESEEKFMIGDIGLLTGNKTMTWPVAYHVLSRKHIMSLADIIDSKVVTFTSTFPRPDPVAWIDYTYWNGSVAIKRRWFSEHIIQYSPEILKAESNSRELQAWLNRVISFLVETESSVLSSGYVPNKETAIKIAVAVWIPIFGKEQIEKEKPYQARLEEDVWTVEGTFPKGEYELGGAAEARIDKMTGQILSVIHYQ